MHNCCHSRRDFIRTVSLGTAGAVTAGLVHPGRVEGAWSPGMQINPHIDNWRVVCCYDAGLLKSPSANIPNILASNDETRMRAQTDAVDAARVERALDLMALSLADRDNIAAAWATIFQRPSRGWSTARVAIKVNASFKLHPAVAIVGKVCRELHTLGVPYENIVLYDIWQWETGGEESRSNPRSVYAPYIGAGIPAGVHADSARKETMGGSLAPAPVPPPAVGDYPVVKALADGEIDVLVNIAVNKGHEPWNGSYTLCMKNHFGTFTSMPYPGEWPDNHGDYNYIIAINKSDAIIGGTPPRQQLCIVDSIFGAMEGPIDIYTLKDPCRIVMGTFAPAVDFLTVRRIREEVMGATHDAALVDGVLPHFGYDPADPAIRDAQFVMVEIPTTVQPTRHQADRPGGIVMRIVRRRGPGGNLKLLWEGYVPTGERMADITILNAEGRRILHRQSAMHFEGESAVVLLNTDGVKPNQNAIVRVRVGSQVFTDAIVL